MSRQKVAEAKSRVTRPARSVYDIQVGDGIIIASDGEGENVRKIVQSIVLDSNSVVVALPDGSGQETITLSFDNPAKTANGNFRYWLDESQSSEDNMPAGQTEDFDDFDLNVDDGMDDMMLDGPGELSDTSEFGESDEEGGEGETDDGEAEYDESAEFTEEEEVVAESDEANDPTLDGGVDDSEYAGNDGEDPEDVAIGSQDVDDAGLETMVDDDYSNDQGEAPEDEVETHGDVEGTQPNNATVLPGSSTNESRIRMQVKQALTFCESGGDPLAVAPLLLRGESLRSVPRRKPQTAAKS